MNNELERIIDGINEKLRNRPFLKKDNDDGIFIAYWEGIPYLEFLGGFGEKAKSMEEFKPLWEYLNSNGYKTNLD